MTFEGAQAKWMRLARNCLLLEGQPHGELHDPWTTADQAGRRPDRGSYCAAHGRGNLPEIGVARIGHRIREVGVVEEIEEVRPELETNLFGA
jgi:hypothetical protein